MLRSIFAASLLSLSGCIASNSSTYTVADIDQTPPAGTVEGAPFAAQTISVTRSGSSLDVELYAAATTDACDPFAAPGGWEVLFTVPAEVGDYPLKFAFGESGNQTVTFAKDSNNIIATQGIIHVAAVSDTSVTLGLVASAGDSEINGTFTTQLCK
jgi:hypothetical protein